jgi:hypothetical protein
MEEPTTGHAPPEHSPGEGKDPDSSGGADDGGGGGGSTAAELAAQMTAATLLLCTAGNTAAGENADLFGPCVRCGAQGGIRCAECSEEDEYGFKVLCGPCTTLKDENDHMLDEYGWIETCRGRGCERKVCNGCAFSCDATYAGCDQHFCSLCEPREEGRSDFCCDNPTGGGDEGCGDVCRSCWTRFPSTKKTKRTKEEKKTTTTTTEGGANVDGWQPGVGDTVLRRGEVCRVVFIDRSIEPNAYTVSLPDGREIGTELSRLSAYQQGGDGGASGTAVWSGPTSAFCKHCGEREEEENRAKVPDHIDLERAWLQAVQVGEVTLDMRPLFEECFLEERERQRFLAELAAMTGGGCAPCLETRTAGCRYGGVRGERRVGVWETRCCVGGRCVALCTPTEIASRNPHLHLTDISSFPLIAIFIIIMQHVKPLPPCELRYVRCEVGLLKRRRRLRRRLLDPRSRTGTRGKRGNDCCRLKEWPRGYTVNGFNDTPPFLLSLCTLS